MSLDPNWLSAFGTIIQAVVAIVALIIAILAMKIAKEQKAITDRQNKNIIVQINIALYERRFRVYDKVRFLLYQGLGGGKEITSEIIDDFRGVVQESQFLFNQNIREFIQKILENAIDLQFVYSSYKWDDKYCTERDQLINWFEEQIKCLDTIFEKDLSYHNLEGK